MWVVSISKNGRELLRTPIRGAMVLIGRSPVCDIVLRAPGLQSVHFLIEWIGEGEPTPGPLDWSIFDLSQTSKNLSEKESASGGAGQGLVLGSERVNLEGFEFHWVEDRLQETEIEGGLIRSQVRGNVMTSATGPSGSQLRKSVLESIEVDVERETVTEISHTSLRRQKKAIRPFVSDLNLIVKFESGEFPQAKLMVPSEQKIQIFNRGVPQAQEKEIAVGPQDILQINWKLKEYYFRLVPEIDVPAVPRQILKDPLYRWFAGVSLFFLILVWLVLTMDRPLEILPKEPPRVARVEIQEVLPPPELADTKIPEIEQPVKPPEPPPEEVKQATPKSQLPTIAPESAKKAPQVAPIPRKDPPAPERKGLNTKAPSGPVNSMGLLGAIKNKGTPNQVKADKVINDGIVSDRVSGAKGQFTVKQPPMGTIGPSDKQGSGPSLSAASTTLKTGDSTNSQSLAQIAGGKGLKGDAPDYDVSFRGEDTEGESVEGGLDRDSVKKTMDAFKKEFRACYERALLTKPRVRGRMVFRWTISAQGATQSTRLERSEVGLPSFENCTKLVIDSIRWPKALNGKSTMVRYPFEFQKKN